MGRPALAAVLVALLACLSPTVSGQGTGGAPAGQGQSLIRNIPPEEAAKQVTLSVLPQYPEAAKQAQIAGTVDIALGISPSGEVGNGTRVLVGPPALTQPALDAMRQWKFQPSTEQGAPTFSRVRALVRFKPDGTVEVAFAPAILPDSFGDPGTLRNTVLEADLPAIARSAPVSGTEQQSVSPSPVVATQTGQGSPRPALNLADTQFSFTLLHTFAAAPGEDVPRTLIQASDGNFYGTTSVYGTVLKMTPDGVVTALHTFTNRPGGGAVSLIQASDGNFYGTTHGDLFRMTPDGAITTLYTFSGGPVGILLHLQARDGSFYGTTSAGGAPFRSTVFKMTPDGTVTTLHTFTGGEDGGAPSSLIQASDGNFYGVMIAGGTSRGGTFFKMTPDGTATTLHAFTFDPLGDNHPGILIQGRDGNFYGTTIVGGASGNGAILKITLDGAVTTLHAFTGGADGAVPSSLIQASDGNFYGTTFSTIFKTAADGAITTLHTFITSGTDGTRPRSLIQARDGSFYGTSMGNSGGGALFRITPMRGMLSGPSALPEQPPPTATAGQRVPAAPTQPGQAPRRITVDGQVEAGRILDQPQPIYPPLARQARIQGDVILHAIVDKEGRVSQLQVVSGHPLLVKAALDAVNNWRYQPTQLNGEPVEVDTTITVTFKLMEPPTAANAPEGGTDAGPVPAGAGGVGRPVCIYCPEPTFSQAARNAKTGGTVVLRVVITADGRATNIQVVSGPGMGLEENAVAAVSTWRFKPAMGTNGAPVAVVTLLQVTFALL